MYIIEYKRVVLGIVHHLSSEVFVVFRVNSLIVITMNVCVRLCMRACVSFIYTVGFNSIVTLTNQHWIPVIMHVVTKYKV